MAKKATSNSLAIISTGFCFLFSLLAYDASARTLKYWDNDGTNTPTGGIFDTNTTNWATSGTLTNSTVAFTNGDFAIFTAGATTAGTIIVTNNTTNLSITGLDNNGVSGSFCTLTLAGTGSFSLLAGSDQVWVSAGATTTFNVPITGPGTLAVGAGGGTLILNTSNSYSGGTTLVGGPVVEFNNSNAFGTGPISAIGTTAGQSILNTTAGVITLTNAFVMNNGGEVFNFAGGNVTSTGPWTLMATPQLKNNANTAPLTISGPISGAFGLDLQNTDGTGVGNGTITLSGANTYTGQTLIGLGTVGGTTTLSVASINSVANPPQQPSSSLGVPSSVANGTIAMGATSYPCALIYTGSGETSDRVISLVGTTGAITIAMNGAGPLVLTSSFTVPTNGAKTLTLEGTSTATNTIAGAIPNSGSGATTFTKAQAGTWVLTGTNTFSGNTTISAGTLIIRGSGKLNNGSYGGTIANSGTFTYNSSSSQTLSGVISGAGTLTEAGSGTLVLSGANTYSGNTTISGGILQVDHADSPGTSGPLGKATAVGSIIMSGGTLQYVAANGAQDYSSRFSTATGQAYNIDVNGQTVTFGTALSSSTGELTLTSTAAGGSLTLNAPASYGGATTINSGTLTIGSSSSLGSGGTYAPNITDNGGFVYDGSSAQILSGTFSGTGSLTENGPGSLTLSGAVTYSGATIIGASSTLYLTGAAPTNLTSSLNIAAGGTLDVSAISSSTYTFPNSTSLTATGSSSAAANINGASGEVINLGSQPMSFTISPTTFTGANQPALIIPQSLSLGGNIITVNNASGTPLGAGNYVLIQVGSGTTTGTPSQYVTVTGAGLVGGDFATVQVVSGNVVLSVQQPPNGSPTWNGNDYANSPTWSDAANWMSGAPDPTGDSVFFVNGSSQTPVMDSSYSVYSLTFFGGAASDILTNSGGSVLTVGSGVTNDSGLPQTLALPIKLVDLGPPTVPSQWNTAGGNITVTGVISDNNIGLAVTGGSTLALNGLNTYTGGTTINGATLSANTVADAASSIGPSGLLTIEGGGGFAFTGTSGATARTVAVEGSTTDTINVSSGSTLSLNGQVHSVSDTAAQMLTLTGGGTLNLGGTVDNSGLTMAINQGELVITKTSTSTAHGLGGGTTIVGTGSAGNSAELQLAGSGNFDLYSGCIVMVNSPDGFVDLNGQSDSFSTLTLSGAGPNGNGALINSATGTTSSITNGGSAVVLAGNTTIGGSGNIKLASVVSGSGMSLTYDGTGTLTLAATNTYSGGTFINSGTVVDAAGGSATTSGGTGLGTVTLASNATLTVDLTAGTTTSFANTAIVGPTNSVVNLVLTTVNLWLTNDLSGFLGTFNVNYTSPGGQLVVGNTSNYTTAINSSAIWNVAVGAVLDLNGLQTNPATVILNGLANPPNTSANNGALRVDGGSLQSGPVILNGNSSIGNGLSTAGMISGTISDGGNGYGFTKVGADPIILSAGNTYSGSTIIKTGTLALGTGGSINNSSNLSIAAGGTFDVSALASSTYNLSGSTSLSAAGTGTTLGTTAAAINGAASGTVNLGSQPVALTYTPASQSGDITHPALYVSQGALQLNNNTITVNNASGHPLGAGIYTIIEQAAGSISGTPNSAVTVTGSGVAAGTTSSLVVSGGSLNLVVIPPTPVISSVTAAGGKLIFSGTNGPANGTYIVLTSTNVATPIQLWMPLSTNSFDGTGGFSVTNNVGANPSSFFLIEIQIPN